MSGCGRKPDLLGYNYSTLLSLVLTTDTSQILQRENGLYTHLLPSTFTPVMSGHEWARQAFTVQKLNKIQSKLFPVAFGTNEPILLCAPTGAGKVCWSSS
jgi:hypothetical protein